MTRGRKPKPTNLKILYGNQGKRALNEDEPTPDVELVRCPEYIIGEAREQWNTVGPQLEALGVMTRLDAMALAMLANSCARWIAAEAMVKKTGEVLKSAEGGFYQNPYLAVANKAWEQMNKMLVEFGMTPSSRSRITANKPGTTDDFEAQLARMNA